MSATRDPHSLQYEPSASWAPAPPVRRVSDRARLAARLRALGPAGLSDAEALALAAGVAPDAAHRVLTVYGSLPEALGATAADLARLVPAGAAARLVLMADVSRRLSCAPLRRRSVLSSWASVLAYLRVALAGVGREQFRVLFLDKKNQLIADEVLGHGTVDHAPVYPREVVRRALELNASALVIAHNHPSGDPTPSSADVEMTRKVVAAAQALGIAVHDHIVVGGQATASFKALGLM